ncbi:MAG: PIN domain-containing protein [Polyangiales bacterium]
MIVAPFRVVLDANVLFPFTLRDTLLRAALAGLFQVYWSDEILTETTRNLVATGTTTSEQATRLRTVMERAFPAAMVTGYEGLISAMHNDEKDRHVVAAAVKAGAQVIVTSNLKDFDPLPDGIEAQSPDQFLCHVFDLDPDDVVGLLEAQASALKRPERTFDELVSGLAKTVPNFAAAVRAHVDTS